VSTSYGAPPTSQVESGVEKKRRVTANWPGPGARALLTDGAALTIKAMARVERMDLIATILDVV
jgi:hypothetical protein